MPARLNRRRRRGGAAAAVLLAAAAAAICAALGSPRALGAERPARTIDMSKALDAGAAPVPSDVAIGPAPPDPTPLVEKEQWVLDLRWDRGDVFLLDVRAIQLAVPQATPRAMGRFALELFEGPTLIERVRFDFPLLGAGDVGDGGPSLTKKLRTRIGVVFPATRRGTRLELLDRATGRRWSLPWPPARSPAGSPASPPGAEGGDAAGPS